MKYLKGIVLYIVKGLMIYAISFAIITFLVVVYRNFSLEHSLFDYSILETYDLIPQISFLSSLGLILYIPASIKRFKNQYNKDNYNALMTKRDAKKQLLKVSFTLDKIQLTIYDRIQIVISKISHQINKRFGTDLYEIKKWKIGDEEVYKRSGLPIITKRNKVWLDPSDSHNLIVGTTNSGKTFSILFEMIELTRLAGESAVIVDLKGELSEATYQKFKDDGYDCYCIDFINPSKSDGWNPFDMGMKAYMNEIRRSSQSTQTTNLEIERLKKFHERRYGKHVPFYYDIKNEKGDPIMDKEGNAILYRNFTKAETYFSDVCDVIFNAKNEKDPFWMNSAKDLALGALYFLAETEDSEVVNLNGVQKLIETGDVIVKKDMTYLDMAMSFGKPADALSKKLNSYLKMTGGTRSSVRAMFNTTLSKYTINKDLVDMMAHNDINLKEIGNHKTVIFLKVHDEKSVYYPLVNLFIAQLYESLIEASRENVNLKLKVPLNILWDEFGSSPYFEPITNVLSAGRSRGIRVTLVVQGLDQLEATYGREKARTIKNNCMNKVYLLSGDEGTLKEFSNLAGKKHTDKGGRDKDEPLFSTERLSKFKLGEALFVRQRQNPFFTKLLPYDKYVFYKKSKTQFEDKPKPTAKYIDVKEYINRGGKG